MSRLGYWEAIVSGGAVLRTESSMPFTDTLVFGKNCSVVGLKAPLLKL